MLPWQVPENSRGQFFAVEKYYFQEQHEHRCRQFADVLLKLNCYHDMLVNHDGDEWVTNPKPEDLVQWLSEGMKRGHLYVLLDDGDGLITLFGGDSYMALSSPTDEILELVTKLAAAAGLFVWQAAV